MASSTQLALHIADTPKELAHVAADIIVDLCHTAINEQGKFSLALSGGSTPSNLFNLLATPEYSPKIPWEKVLVYWVDERCVAPDHPESNYRVARTELLQKVEATKFYRMKGELPPADAAMAYETLLKQHFDLAEGELPRFDCILLGMGSDGHVASLFPEEDGPLINNRLVVDQYVRKLKSARLTLTLPVINNARACVFMVQGAQKHSVLAKALDILATPELPAHMVHPTNGQLIWVIDEAARKGQE